MLNLFVLLRGQVHRLTPTFIIEPIYYRTFVLSVRLGQASVFSPGDSVTYLWLCAYCPGAQP